MKDKSLQSYHYTESGLDSVYIYGLEFEDDEGEKCVMIQSINKLHACIAMGLIQQQAPLDEQEIYFLRAELEMSENSLKQQLGLNTSLTLQEAFADNPQQEKAFRLLIATRISPVLEGLVESLLEKIQQLEILQKQESKKEKAIEIDAPTTDNRGYSLRLA